MLSPHEIKARREHAHAQISSHQAAADIASSVNDDCGAERHERAAAWWRLVADCATEARLFHASGAICDEMIARASRASQLAG